MKGYGEYKNVGLSWLNEAPMHWEIRRGKQLFAAINERSQSGTEELLSVSAGHGVVKRKNANVTMFQASSYTGYKLCWPDDLVINSLWAWQQGLGFSKYHGIISTAYSVFRLRNPKTSNPRYYNYFLRGVDYLWELHVRSKGIWKSRYQLSDDDFLRSPMICPPREEQDQIVRYLDAKVGNINKLIRIKQKQIALLKEKKQAIINQAVTKGLDPNAPMKDSGIAWIGQIPEGWEVERLKFLMKKIVDCPHETPHYSADGTYFVIRTADQDYGFLRNTEQMYRLDSQEYQQRIRRERLLKDDVVYGREGERWGLACLVPESDMFCLGQRMMQFRCNTDKVIPLFAVLMLNAQYIYRQGTLDTLGSTSPHVNIATIKNYYCIIPCMKDQEYISIYVNTVSDHIENIIKNVENKIAGLTAYRTRLISDVVTGKLDVRQIAIACHTDEVELEKEEVEESESAR